MSFNFEAHDLETPIQDSLEGAVLHGIVVSNLAYFVAKEMELPEEECYKLAVAGLLHDIGKLKELSTFPANDYTDAGQLLGHIMIGAEWVGEAIREVEGFPAVLANELKHCILAHHGELEFGSPKKPALVEALALSFADNLDAKMETVKEMLAGVPDGNMEWQGYSRLLESNIRRTSTWE